MSTMEPGRILCSAGGDSGIILVFFLVSSVRPSVRPRPSVGRKVGSRKNAEKGKEEASSEQSTEEGGEKERGRARASERDDSIENRWCARINQYGAEALPPSIEPLGSLAPQTRSLESRHRNDPLDQTRPTREARLPKEVTLQK